MPITKAFQCWMIGGYDNGLTSHMRASGVDMGRRHLGCPRQEVRPFSEGGGDYDPGASAPYWEGMLGEQARRNQVSEALAKSRGLLASDWRVLTVAGMANGQWGGNKKRGDRPRPPMTIILPSSPTTDLATSRIVGRRPRWPAQTQTTRPAMGSHLSLAMPRF
jgi:hypothetical protein